MARAARVFSGFPAVTAAVTAATTTGFAARVRSG
jgi:hypothetical protein